MTETSPQLPDHTVQLFLADRDAPCPGCGYNLRGIQEPVCPECGRRVELTVSRPGRGRGYLCFVLLALGWVLTAGTMNAVRTWRVVRLEAEPVMLRQSSFGTVISSGPGSITRTWSTSGSAVVTVNPGGGIRINTVVSGATPPGMVWSNVSQQTWITLGWWSGLGLLALTTLVIAIVRRRRFAGDVPPRRIVGAACLLFALYAGYHALMFSRAMFI